MTEKKEFDKEAFFGKKSVEKSEPKQEPWMPDEFNEPTEPTQSTQPIQPATKAEPAEQSEPPKRTTPRQRKASLEEYQQTFLRTPKIVDRQSVFISRELRDEVDKIARRYGERKMSVSGFIENLVRHHLANYAEELERWKRM